MGFTTKDASICSLKWITILPLLIGALILGSTVATKLSSSNVVLSTMSGFFYLIVGVALAISLHAFLTLCSGVRQYRRMALISVVLNFILIFLLVPVFFYTIMYSNGVGNDKLDKALEDFIETSILDFSSVSASDWEEIQESFECCGVSTTSLVESSESLIIKSLNEQLTGDDTLNCSSYISTLFPVYDFILDQDINSEDAISTLAYDSGIPKNFFCLDKLRSLVQDYTLYAAIATAFFLAIELLILFAGLNLLCYTDYFSPEEDSKGTVGALPYSFPESSTPKAEPAAASEEKRSRNPLFFKASGTPPPTPPTPPTPPPRKPDAAGDTFGGNSFGNDAFPEDDPFPEDEVDKQRIDEIFQTGKSDVNSLGTGAPPPGMQRRPRRNRSNPEPVESPPI